MLFFNYRGCCYNENGINIRKCFKKCKFKVYSFNSLVVNFKRQDQGFPNSSTKSFT